VPPTGSVAHHTRARRHLLAASGDEDTAAGVARHYARHHPGLVHIFVLDAGDAGEWQAVADLGLDPVMAPVLDPAGLARAVADVVTAGMVAPVGMVVPTGMVAPTQLGRVEDRPARSMPRRLLAQAAGRDE
jgi:hypothetical protein